MSDTSPTPPRLPLLLRVLLGLLLVGGFTVLAFRAPSVAVVVGVMAAAICLHELGHLVTARFFGMGPDCFFVGFGPKLWSRVTRKGLEVGVRAIPAGGYVRIPHMDLRTRRQAPAGSYATANWHQQVLVAVAGVAVQLAFVFPLAFAASYTLPSGDPSGAVVTAGLGEDLHVGDVILTVGGEPFLNAEQLRQASPGVSVSISRDGELLDVVVADPGAVITDYLTAPATSNMVARGLFAGMVTVQLPVQVVQGIPELFSEVPQMVTDTWSGEELSDQRTRSVLGLGEITTQVEASTGWFGVLLMAIQVNVFIALFNLVPFYPFDGGHVVNAVMARLLARRERWVDVYLAVATRVLLVLGLVVMAVFGLIIVVDLVEMTGLPGWVGLAAYGAGLAGAVNGARERLVRARAEALLVDN